jgi:hypothetical protein
VNQSNESHVYLEIYVSRHYWSCEEVFQIVEQARQIPRIEVQVLDLDQPRYVPPPRIFAFPTYVLNGKIVSLGNPEREAFLARLQREKSINA